MPSPADGTDSKKIVEVARKFGLEASVAEQVTFEELKRALAAGYTPILEIQAWPTNEKRPASWREVWDSGHYVVLTALTDEWAYTMDPSVPASYTYLPISELLDRWHNVDEPVGAPGRPYQHLAILIHGKNPSRLIRME
ncbi:MAG: C39 family peptidase [Deltaproteobacteria bacterium]|nr:C39 family peptidase [Deltaproteobacteria bacterium]